MTNPWKLATIGLALAGVTALSTGLTTAWMLRPAEQAETEPVSGAATAGPSVRYAAPAPAAARPAAPRATAAAARVTRATTAPVVTPVAATTTAPTDCATGGDRALRIAKPGALGALLGAGLGAASGAIADGGKAAGKGALIGGIAGAALGTGYGAYKTKNECGTIFGDGANAVPSAPAAVPAMQAAGVDRIAIYPAR